MLSTPAPSKPRFNDHSLHLEAWRFPGVVEKAAALVYSIVAFHPFADGNKRTALVAADVVLRLNGLRLRPSDEIEPYFWSIARGEQDEEQIAAWLARRTEKLAQ